MNVDNSDTIIIITSFGAGPMGKKLINFLILVCVYYIYMCVCGEREGEREQWWAHPYYNTYSDAHMHTRAHTSIHTQNLFCILEKYYTINAWLTRIRIIHYTYHLVDDHCRVILNHLPPDAGYINASYIDVSVIIL